MTDLDLLVVEFSVAMKVLAKQLEVATIRHRRAVVGPPRPWNPAAWYSTNTLPGLEETT